MSLVDNSITKTKSIRDLINSNSAFTNVYNPVITVLNTQVQTVKGILNIEPPETPLGQSKADILGAITSLENTINRFTSHTNALSGIGLSTGLSGANIGTVMQVLRTIDKYKDDGAACEFINEVFGSIINATHYIEQIRIIYNRLLGLTNEPELLAERINTLVTLLEGRITNDLMAFAEAQLRALQLALSSSLSQLLGNECLSEIISIVGTQELRGILNGTIAGAI